MKWLKRLVLAVVTLAGLALAAFWMFAPGIVERGRNAVAEHAPYPVSDAAAALHGRLTVGDWHADSLLWKRDLLARGDRGQVDIPRLIEGGVALQVFTAVTKSPAGLNYDSNADDAFDNITLLAFGQLWPIRTWQSIYQRAIYQAEKLQRFEAKSGGRLKIIRTRADLDNVLAARARGEVVVGGILGVEGLHPLEGKIANLQGLIEAGHRVFGLQHFFDNELGGTAVALTAIFPWPADSGPATFVDFPEKGLGIFAISAAMFGFIKLPGCLAIQIETNEFLDFGAQRLVILRKRKLQIRLP